MAADSQETSRRRPRIYRRVTLAAGTISVALLGSYFLVEMSSPAQQERWRQVVSVALAAVLLAGGILVFGRDRMRAVFRAPLTGLFVGMTGAVILGSVIAASEWLTTARFPTASLCATVLLGMPSAALLGTLTGLLSWLAFRVVPYRSPATAAQPQRRRFQFGLRTLLFTVFVIALALWIATPAQRNYQHQRAVSRLLEAGARINFDDSETEEWLETLFGSRVTPEWYAQVRSVNMESAATDEDIAYLEYLPEVTSLELRCPQITDRGLAHLQQLQALQSLHLSYAEPAGLKVLGSLPTLRFLSLDQLLVDDEVLAEIAKLPQLEQLHLRNVIVTAAALEHLSHTKTLRYLTLLGTNITGNQLACLSELPNLELLNLDGAPITDADLATIAPLKKLRYLVLDRTLVTDTGLADLESLPSLRNVFIRGTGASKAGAQQLLTVLRARNKDAEVHGP